MSPAAEHPCASWNTSFELSVSFGVGGMGVTCF